jgi:hypothetical protein
LFDTSIGRVYRLNIKTGFESKLCVGLTTSPPSVSWFSRQCGILTISQPYRPPLPVTRIVLHLSANCVIHNLSCIFWG